VTDGWVAGALFENWRFSEHVACVGGEADPLHAYLSSRILDRLAPHDRWGDMTPAFEVQHARPSS
jgi:hypothetical protein